MGGEVVACELNGLDVDRHAAAVGSTAEPTESIGEGGGDLDPGKVADRLVDVGEQ